MNVISNTVGTVVADGGVEAAVGVADASCLAEGDVARSVIKVRYDKQIVFAGLSGGGNVANLRIMDVTAAVYYFVSGQASGTWSDWVAERAPAHEVEVDVFVVGNGNFDVARFVDFHEIPDGASFPLGRVETFGIIAVKRTRFGSAAGASWIGVGFVCAELHGGRAGVSFSRFGVIVHHERCIKIF